MPRHLRPEGPKLRPAKPKTQRIRTYGRNVLHRNDQICEARSEPIAMRIAECLRVFAGLRTSDWRPGADDPGSVRRILAHGDRLRVAVCAAFEGPAVPPALRGALRGALCAWWEQRGNFVESRCRGVEQADTND